MCENYTYGKRAPQHTTQQLSYDAHTPSCPSRVNGVERRLAAIRRQLWRREGGTTRCKTPTWADEARCNHSPLSQILQQQVGLACRAPATPDKGRAASGVRSILVQGAKLGWIYPRDHPGKSLLCR